MMATFLPGPAFQYIKGERVIPAHKRGAALSGGRPCGTERT